MIATSLELLSALIGAFALVALTVPLAKRIALRYGILALPRPDSAHTEPTPVLGGVSIILAILTVMALFGVLPGWALFGAPALLLVGLIDDIVVLRPSQKFAMEVVVIAAVVMAAPPFRLAGSAPANAGLAIFWLLATTNAFNLTDGLDGLASGIGIIAASAIATVGILHNDVALAIAGMATAGALGGFLIYNFHPASIFMGDSGALTVGLLLGMLSLYGGQLAKNSRLTPYLFPMLVMLVPLLDTSIVTVTRLATGSAISRHGRDHSHHRLMSLGLSDVKTVFACWSVALLGAACALLACLLPYPYVAITTPFLALGVGVIALFMMDLSFESIEPGAAYGYVQGIARYILSLTYRRRLTEAVMDLALIVSAFFGAYLIRLDFRLEPHQVGDMIHALPWIVASTYLALITAGVYRGMWRYSGLSDAIRFAKGAALAGILMVVMSACGIARQSGSIVVLFTLLLFNLLVGTRMSFRMLRAAIFSLAARGERVLIVGAGQAGAWAALHITSGRDRSLRLVGFADDDTFKRGKLVHGHRVLGTLDELERIHVSTGFNQILLAEDLGEERSAPVWNFAARHPVVVRKLSIQMDEMDSEPNRRHAIDPAIGGAQRAEPAGS